MVVRGTFVKHRLWLAAAVAATVLALGPMAAARPGAALVAGVDPNVAHARGSCGSLGPGSGLRDHKGWVVSMLPGRHAFRTRNGGSVYVTVAKQTALDFDAGRPYFIVVEGALPSTVLEWKTPRSDWAEIPTNFLYPPQNVTY